MMNPAKRVSKLALPLLESLEFSGSSYLIINPNHSISGEMLWSLGCGSCDDRKLLCFSFNRARRSPPAYLPSNHTALLEVLQRLQRSLLASSHTLFRFLPGPYWNHRQFLFALSCHP